MLPLRRALADPRCAQFRSWQPSNPPYQVIRSAIAAARKASIRAVTASYFEEALATTAGIIVTTEDKQMARRHH